MEVFQRGRFFLYGTIGVIFLTGTLSCSFSQEFSSGGLGSTEGLPFTQKSTAQPGNMAPLGYNPGILLFDNDLTNIVNVQSPFNNANNKMVLDDRKIEASVSETSGHAVTVGHKMNAGLGRVPLWQNTNLATSVKDHFDWFRQTYGHRNLGAIGDYVAEGGDVLQTFINTAHRHRDVMPIISIRMNDHHSMHCLDGDCSVDGNPPQAPRNWMSIVFTKLLFDHPEYAIDPTDGFNSYWSKRGANYALDEVRREVLNIIKDIHRGYPVSSIELNFTRGAAYFTDDMSHKERKQIMSAFLQEVRQEVGDTQLIIKGPQALTGDFFSWEAAGLDVSTLNQNGIADMYVLSDYYFTKKTYESDLQQAKALAWPIPVYQELHFAWERTDLPGEGPFIYRCNDEQLFHAANWSYDNGANGLSLFNFQYFRPNFGEFNNDHSRDIPFDIFPHLVDWKWLRLHTEQTIQWQSSILGETMISGDFNGNGQTDLSFFIQDGEQIAVYSLFSGADGIWQSQSQTNIPWGEGLGHQPSVVADFNGDGQTDVAFLQRKKDRLVIHTALAAANGSWEAIPRHEVTNPPLELHEDSYMGGLFNGDNRHDILFFTNENGTLGLETMLAHPDGGWGLQLRQSVAWESGIRHEPRVEGDVNRDGLTDFAFLHDVNGKLGIRTMLAGAGGNWIPQPPQTMGWWEADLRHNPRVVGDFNGDGRTDIAFLSNAGGMLEIRTLLSGNKGLWMPKEPSTVAWWGDLHIEPNVVGDFNGDGLTDFALLFGLEGKLGIRMALAGGDGQWIPQPTQKILWDKDIRLEKVMTGRYDGNETDDILFLIDNGYSEDKRELLKIRQLLSNGDGTWRTWNDQNRGVRTVRGFGL